MSQTCLVLIHVSVRLLLIEFCCKNDSAFLLTQSFCRPHNLITWWQPQHLCQCIIYKRKNFITLLLQGRRHFWFIVSEPKMEPFMLEHFFVAIFSPQPSCLLQLHSVLHFLSFIAPEMQTSSTVYSTFVMLPSLDMILHKEAENLSSLLM